MISGVVIRCMKYVHTFSTNLQALYIIFNCNSIPHFMMEALIQVRMRLIHVSIKAPDIVPIKLYLPLWSLLLT